MEQAPERKAFQWILPIDSGDIFISSIIIILSNNAMSMGIHVEYVEFISSVHR